MSSSLRWLLLIAWVGTPATLLTSCAAPDAECRAGCDPTDLTLELEPAIHFKRSMRVDFVSGGSVIDSQILVPTAVPQTALKSRRTDARAVRWYLDEVLWFEQPLARSTRTRNVCGQTCTSYTATVTLPELPDGTRPDHLPPDCAAVACKDRVVIELVEPVGMDEFRTVSVAAAEPALAGFRECSASCSSMSCTFGAQPAEVDDCAPTAGPLLESLTHWGAAEELTIRGVTERDGVELSFTQSLPVEPAEPHLPSTPTTACSPGCFVGTATLEWPAQLRGAEQAGGAAGSSR